MTLAPSRQRIETPVQAAAVEEFGVAGVRMTFAPGEEIYAQDEDADMVYRLVRGTVRTTRLLSDGRRQIGDFYFAGDLIGLEAGPAHRFSAEALETCEIAVIRKASLGLYGEEGLRIERMIWAETTRELQRTQEHLMLLGRKSAFERVASFLLGMSNRVRGEVAELPMGRQDMADYLGLTIETVSRMVTQLQAEGLVRFLGCRRFEVRDRIGLARLVEA